MAGAVDDAVTIVGAHASAVINNPKAIREVSRALDELLGEAARHAHVFHRADGLGSIGMVRLYLFYTHDLGLRKGERAIMGYGHGRRGGRVREVGHLCFVWATGNVLCGNELWRKVQPKTGSARFFGIGQWRGGFLALWAAARCFLAKTRIGMC